MKSLDAALDAKIEIFDAYGVTADMKRHPGTYGFRETAEFCAKNAQCVADSKVVETCVQ